jgi:hypothetical protein
LEIDSFYRPDKKSRLRALGFGLQEIQALPSFHGKRWLS